MSKKYPINEKIAKKARLLALAGDPTRIRILHLMFDEHRVRVTGIAESLNMSVACISHHLQMLKDNGVLMAEREGNNIYYKLVENTFTKQLEKLIIST